MLAVKGARYAHFLLPKRVAKPRLVRHNLRVAMGEKQKKLCLISRTQEAELGCIGK